MKNPIELAIENAGGMKALASAFEPPITYQAIQKWRKNGVPIDRVLEVERITNVPREKLRPEFFNPAKRAAK